MKPNAVSLQAKSSCKLVLTHITARYHMEERSKAWMIVDPLSGVRQRGRGILALFLRGPAALISQREHSSSSRHSLE